MTTKCCGRKSRDLVTQPSVHHQWNSVHTLPTNLAPDRARRFDVSRQLQHTALTVGEFLTMLR